MGNEKKKLLTSLPSKFFLPPEDFKELYEIFGSWSPSKKDGQDLPS